MDRHMTDYLSCLKVNLIYNEVEALKEINLLSLEYNKR